MTSSNKVKGFAAGVVAAVCYGTNPLGTLELYGDGFNSVRYSSTAISLRNSITTANIATARR